MGISIRFVISSVCSRSTRQFCRPLCTKQGFFISHTCEDVLVNLDGKQLMCEALYLFGVM